MIVPLRTPDSPAAMAGLSGRFTSGSDGDRKHRWVRFLDPTIFAFLLLFAVTLPHSIKGAERSWKIAFVLWLVKLVVDRKRPIPQALAAPLLAYALLSAISTALSPDPFLSWDRIKFVCLYVVGIVVAQNVKRISQVRWLVLLFVISGFAAAVFTGWQYAYGIGVRIDELPKFCRLVQTGLGQGYVITKYGAYEIHSPEELATRLTSTPPAERVSIVYLTPFSPQPDLMSVTPRDFLESGLGTSRLRLTRGRPFRAQGTLGHYVVFAEMMMQIGCMAWALLLSMRRDRIVWTLFLGIAFLGIAAALFMTETRAAVAGLTLGCLVSLWFLAGRKTRIFAVALLIVVVAIATLWIRYSRGTEWVDRSDISTQFRVMMWEDGIRLIGQHPWFGVGMETVRTHYREWNIRAFLQYNVRSHFHSTFLQIAVERGIPALLAWIWFCAAYFLFLLRLIPRLRVQSRFAAGVATGALAGLVAFTCTAFFHYNLGEESLAMVLFFYYGLAAAMNQALNTPSAIDVD